MNYKLILSLLVAIVMFTSTAYANIYEVKSIAEMQAHINNMQETALLIIDIDETVLVSAQLLGSSKWFYHGLEELTLLTTNKEHAFNAMLRKYLYTHDNTKMDLVEGQHTTNFIETLHVKHHVLFITARDARMTKTTERQLSENDLLFNKSSLFKDKSVQIGLFGADEGVHNKASNGIIYVNGGDKGICLEKYLLAIGCDPSNFAYIVAIDDKEKNLHQISNAAQRMNLPFIGFRYGAADHLHNDLDLSIANLQYEAHKRDPEIGFLSNAEAQQRLQH